MMIIKVDHGTVFIAALVFALLFLAKGVLLNRKITAKAALVFLFLGFYLAAYLMAFLEIVLDINHFWDGALFGSILSFGMFAQALIVQLVNKKIDKRYAAQELVFQTVSFSAIGALLAG